MQSSNRPGFSRRAQYSRFIGYMVAAAGMLVGVILLALSSFDPAAFRALRSGAAELTTPVSSGLAWAGDGIASVPEGIGSYFGVRSENARLKQELAAQRDLIMRARTIVRDNQRLRVLLKLRDGNTGTVAVARLVSSTGSSTRRFAILNAGSWQGVHTGMSVRGPEGLIGRTVAVGPNNARVMLLADTESIVPVRRTRDGLAAIAVGRGDGWVEIRSAAGAAVAFNRDDLFVTSGNGGLFPPGVPVARVIAKATDIAVGRTFAQPDTTDFAMVMPVFVEQPAEPAPPAK